MKELHFQGWLGYDEDDNLVLRYNATAVTDSLQKLVSDFFSNSEYLDEGLGVELDIIPNVSLRVYVTDSACSLDEAVGSVVANLYGDIRNAIEYVGYSEYTITGYCCKEFTIGGHDLYKELLSYVGRYIHFVMEIPE